MATTDPVVIDNSTSLMHLQSGEYPIRFWELRRRVTNASFSETPDEEFINMLGYVVVHPTTRPDGMVAEGAPVLEDGIWKQTWAVRTLEGQELEDYLTQQRAVLNQQLDEVIRNDLSQGFPYLFPDAEIYHVQMRNEDRNNIAGARLNADAEIAANNGDGPTFFIPLENVIVPITFTFMHDLASVAYTKYMGYLARKRAAKDAIANAKTIEALPETPQTLWDEAE